MFYISLVVVKEIDHLKMPRQYAVSKLLEAPDLNPSLNPVCSTASEASLAPSLYPT